MSFRPARPNNAKGLSQAMEGSVGQMLQTTLQPSGKKIELMVDRLEGKPGAQFVLTRAPTLATIESLQSRLVLAERGRQSGVISANLQDTDPERMRTYAESSPSVVTPLNKYIGYEAAAKVAKQALADGATIRETVLTMGFVERGELTEEQLDEALDVESMTRP